MRALAIETATTACAIALRDGDDVIERVLDTERRHTEALTGGIAELLDARSLSARDLELVVVDRGPGLFTGLRVGLAAAQALARGLGVALVEVTSLELLAASARRRGQRGVVTALVDARRGEVFAQSFFLDGDVVAIDEPRVLAPAALIESWRDDAQHRVVTGDGALRYRAIFEALDGAVVLDESVPSPREALILAEGRTPVEFVTPLYLREADAVSNFTVRADP